MKKTAILISALFVGLIFLNFTYVKINLDTPAEEEGVTMSVEIKTVIDQSCYGCHNSESKNLKAKNKLNFDRIGKDYSAIKSAGKLKEIAEVIEENDMPPSKFLKNYPEKALTEAQKTLLSDWALAESEKFMEK